jgi:NADH-quinone oxidoreductase subunit J
MTVLQIIFILTALVTLGAAVLVVTSQRLVNAALWLILALAGMAVFYILLEANFLAAVQVVIYIGAIAILLIFGIMLTRGAMDDRGPGANRNWWLAGLVAALLFAGLIAMFSQVPALTRQAAEISVSEGDLLNALGQSLVDVNRFVLPFEVASVLLLAALIGAMVVARPVQKGEEGGEA